MVPHSAPRANNLSEGSVTSIKQRLLAIRDSLRGSRCAIAMLGFANT
jgi:hypothetical protein